MVSLTEDGFATPTPSFPACLTSVLVQVIDITPKNLLILLNMLTIRQFLNKFALLNMIIKRHLLIFFIRRRAEFLIHTPYLMFRLRDCTNISVSFLMRSISSIFISTSKKTPTLTFSPRHLSSAQKLLPVTRWLRKSSSSSALSAVRLKMIPSFQP